jgi:hypothetical protein
VHVSEQLLAFFFFFFFFFLKLILVCIMTEARASIYLQSILGSGPGQGPGQGSPAASSKHILSSNDAITSGSNGGASSSGGLEEFNEKAGADAMMALLLTHSPSRKSTYIQTSSSSPNLSSNVAAASSSRKSMLSAKRSTKIIPVTNESDGTGIGTDSSNDTSSPSSSKTSNRQSLISATSNTANINGNSSINGSPSSAPSTSGKLPSSPAAVVDPRASIYMQTILGAGSSTMAAVSSMNSAVANGKEGGTSESVEDVQEKAGADAMTAILLNHSPVRRITFMQGNSSASSSRKTILSAKRSGKVVPVADDSSAPVIGNVQDATGGTDIISSSAKSIVYNEAYVGGSTNESTAFATLPSSSTPRKLSAANDALNIPSISTKGLSSNDNVVAGDTVSKPDSTTSTSSGKNVEFISPLLSSKLPTDTARTLTDRSSSSDTVSIPTQSSPPSNIVVTRTARTTIAMVTSTPERMQQNLILTAASSKVTFKQGMRDEAASTKTEVDTLSVVVSDTTNSLQEEKSFEDDASALSDDELNEVTSAALMPAAKEVEPSALDTTTTIVEAPISILGEASGGVTETPVDIVNTLETVKTLNLEDSSRDCPVLTVSSPASQKESKKQSTSSRLSLISGKMSTKSSKSNEITNGAALIFADADIAAAFFDRDDVAFTWICTKCERKVRQTGVGRLTERCHLVRYANIAF